MRIFAFVMFIWMFLIPEISTNKTNSDNEVQVFINRLESQYGEETLKLSFYSINELRPYSILQYENTVNKYSNNWVTPVEYLSLLEPEDRESINTRIFSYINDFDMVKQSKMYNKIASYLYTFNVIEKLLVGSDNKFKLKIFKTLRQLDATKVSFEQFSSKGEFEESDLNSNALNQAKVKAYNNISDLDEQSRLLYYSEFFKNISKL